MRFDVETNTVHAGGRSWLADPARTSITDLETGSGYVHRDRRCVVPFESGWSASIIWGSGTYSSNHDSWKDVDVFVDEPTTVEVGVLDHTGELRQRRQGEYELDEDRGWHSVESYLDDVELVALLDRLATLPTDFDYGERPPTLDELNEAARRAGLDLPEPPTSTSSG